MEERVGVLERVINYINLDITTFSGFKKVLKLQTKKSFNVDIFITKQCSERQYVL